MKGGANYAYQAVLLALDAYLLLRGVEIPKRKNIEYYQKSVGQIDKKLFKKLNDAYETLHLAGGYDGNLNVGVNQEGMKTAEEIIEVISPFA